MINDETQDQDLQEEQKAMPADAKALLDKVDMSVPAPPLGDEWVAEAVKAVEASITKLIDEFREQPFIHRIEHSLHARPHAAAQRVGTPQGLVSYRRQRFQDAADPQRVAGDQAAEEEA